MGRPSKAVMEFMERYSIDSDEIWEVHGSTWVVKHKALERVAAEQGIVFDQPQLKVCDLANGLVVVLVSGKLGERSIYSFGEATPKNCKNSYPVAMAEKRAVDRVILKLLAAHGTLYSEAEADEFEQPRQNPHVTRPEDIHDPIEYDQHGQPVDNIPHLAPPDEKLTVAKQRPIFATLQKEIHSFGSIEELREWVDEANTLARISQLKPDWQQILRGVYADHLKALRTQEQGDDMRLSA